MSRATSQLRDDLRKYYNQSRAYLDEMQSHDVAYFAGYLQLVQTYADRLAGPTGTLLELGCGGGASTWDLARRLPAFRCVGIDISAPAVAFAQRKYTAANLQYLNADCLALPFSDASVSVVAARDVIEHLADPELALSEMVRVTRQGGLIIIKSPHHRSPLFALTSLLRLRPHYPFTTTWWQNAPRFAELTVDFVRKALSDEVRFHRRTPDLTDAIVAGCDSDAVYETCVLDLIKFFKKNQFSIENIALSSSSGLASRAITRLLPYLASVGLVAHKQ